MPTPGSLSSHSSGESQPVNPYEATAIASPRSAAGPEVPAPPPRNYRLTMAWADRRRFLRAVGPLRLFGIMGLFLAGFGLLGMIGLAIELRTYLHIQNAYDLLNLVRMVFVVARTAVIVATCWFNWKLADALAATAGGSTSSMGDWSRYQLRLAQLLVTTVSLNFVIDAWDGIVRPMLLDLAQGS